MHSLCGSNRLQNCTVYTVQAKMVRIMSEGIVARFLKCATADMIRNNKTDIRCPCRRCKLNWVIDLDSGNLQAHLLRHGFMDGYTRWISDDIDDGDGEEGGQHDDDHHHGENGRDDEESPGDGEGAEADRDDDDLDAGGADDDGTTSGWVRDPYVQELLLKQTSNARAAAREKAKLAQLEKDAVTPLYEGCRPDDTRLNVTLKAMEMKAKHKLSDASFDDMMAFWHDRLPEGNTCPTSIEDAKKIVCPLDLPHVRYHVCINDCIIYRGEDAEKTTCPVCGVSRYKKGKKAPRKVVWYFPITPRLQRYFADPKEAKLMRWHAERKKPGDDDDDPEKDELLTHPSDASQWKALDLEFPEFGGDSRNIRLGASTDGLNPFGSQSSTHSTWPVFVWMYNLPPWLCMKKKYIQMSMLIQGPKQPGTDINLYLGLLKEELATLWESGANTYDAIAQDYFTMRAALVTTVQDYPGCGYISGQVIQGFCACVRCMDNTSYLQLEKDPGSSTFLGIRKELHGGRTTPDDQEDDDDHESETTQGRRKGKKFKKNEYYCPPSCFTLSQDEIKQFFKCLLGVKFPYGYAGKISRYLDEAKQRFSGMKSHDCAVLMTQVLLVALRGIMDEHVRETLFGLCKFFDVISRKSIGVNQLGRLQEEIVVILCELEVYFPPAFFDIMVHLLVHVVEDIVQLGPMFLRSMMAFERMNGHIKGYVRNRSRPDGSIAKGFLAEECISFCTNYLDIKNPIGLPVNRHLGKLDGSGHQEGRRILHADFDFRRADFDRANLVALQHLELVDPWVQKHKRLIEKKYSDRGIQRTQGEIIKEHNSDFTRWFRQTLLDNPPRSHSSDTEKIIFTLSQGPMQNLVTYQAYDINGYTFYTEEKDNKCDYQNSGVTSEFYTDDNVKERFYGRIEEIWELDYCGEKVPMFRVRWAKSVEREDRYFTTMVIPEAAKSKAAGANVAAKNEPWVLATKVDQCFFITDPTKPSRVVVRRGKRNIIGMDGVANEQDFDQYGDPKIEDDNNYDASTYITRRKRTTLPKKGSPFERRNIKVPGLNYSTATKKGKKIVKR